MASDIEFQYLDRTANKNTSKKSSELAPQFSEVGIGANNIPVTDDSGTLSIGSPVKASDAAGATDLMTKQQVEAVELGLQTQIDDLGTDTAQLQSDVTQLQTDVGTLQTDVGTLQTDVGTLQSDVTQLQTDVGTLQSDVTQLQTDVGTLQSDVATNAGNISTNAGNISTNTSDIADNAGNIGTLQTDVGTLQSDVATNSSSILTNGGNISTNAGDISTNAGNISTNAGNISTLQSDVTQLETDVGILQSDVAAIQANTANEEVQVSGVGGQAVFTLASLTVDVDNTVRDLEVYVDGRRQGLATDGNFDQVYKNFKKTSATEVTFAVAVPEGKVVQFYKQGTAVATNVPLTNIAVDPQPSVHAGQSLGTVTKAWASCFVKDKTTAQVYEIEVDNGTLQATPVP